MMRTMGMGLGMALVAAAPALAQVAAMPTCAPASMSAEEAGFDGYGYTMFGEGFAHYERVRLDDARWEFVIDHCPGGARLTVALEAPGIDGAHQRLNDLRGPLLEAMFGERAYSLADLATLARAQDGVEAGVTTTDAPSCVCREMGF